MPSRHENRVGGNFGGMFVLGLLLILVRKSVPGSTTWTIWWQWSWHRSIRIFIVLCIRGGCVGVMNICVVVGLGQPGEPASAMHRGYCSSRALLVQPATYRPGIYTVALLCYFVLSASLQLRHAWTPWDRQSRLKVTRRLLDHSGSVNPRPCSPPSISNFLQAARLLFLSFFPS
jgi:hypothetical protein